MSSAEEPEETNQPTDRLAQYEKLIAYLNTHVPIDSFFDNNSFDLQALHHALRYAMNVLVDQLIHEWEELKEAAKGPEYSIEIDHSGFHEKFQIDWPELKEMDMTEVDEEMAISYLKDVRVDVASYRDENSRLRAHMHIAVEQKADGNRTSFSFRPRPELD